MRERQGMPVRRCEELNMSSRLQNFLVAIDGSEPSNRALDAAAELARSANGTLSIVNVASPLSDEQKAEFARVGGDLANAADVLALRALDNAKQRAAWSGLPHDRISATFRLGEPAASIIDCIVASKVDAVVVGRRGRGQLEGLLFGSVSQKLATLSPCPVLVVP
jgi:nucleotide-binding universal stress UspA family protein